MNFTENIFWVYIAFFFLVYFLCVRFTSPTSSIRNIWIALGSLILYATAYPPAVLVVLFHAGLAHLVGPIIHKKSRASLLALAFAITCGLAILCTLKYSTFFSALLYSDPLVPMPAGYAWVLPLGISFYTFTAIAYYVDLYRGQIQPATGFIDVLILIVFWPHLACGPILRAKNIFPFLRSPLPLTQAQLASALLLIENGLVKKLLIADNLARYVDWNIAHDVIAMSQPEAWGTLLGYAGQIYADFSGYSDLAIGFSILLGFRLPANFNYPYLATSLSDFWKRWHISLSTWFRDYLYIPLGGNRHGRARKMVALFIVFSLSGLWHGAALNYVAWGCLHGMFLILENILSCFSFSVPIFLKRIATLTIVVSLWAPFRLSLDNAWLLLQKCYAWTATPVYHSTSPFFLLPIAGLLGFIVLEHLLKPIEVRADGFCSEQQWPKQLAYVAVLVPLAFLFSGQAMKFLYFEY